MSIYRIYDHIAPKFSELEVKMVKHIPPGGNWRNIPIDVPSKRLEQIRKSGGRTTYYGRLEYDKPAYTISTYFHRIGNGSNLHPEQNRIISIREGARLQSFPDKFRFFGPKGSKYKQIGNAVPPLLARAVAESLKPYVKDRQIINLFSGAGGLSEGFVMSGFKIRGCIEIDPNFYTTYTENLSKGITHGMIRGDIANIDNKKSLIQVGKEYGVGVVIGGPPCQGFSTAGWRDKEDPRNTLFKHFMDIVNGIKPECFVLENVPGILSMDKGNVKKTIISSFADIGYQVKIIKTKAEEYGVPQKRRRVFFVGFPKNDFEFSVEPIFSETDSKLPPPITVREAIYDLPPLQPGQGEPETTFNVEYASPYEEMMMELISFSEFYNKIKSDTERSTRLRNSD